MNTGYGTLREEKAPHIYISHHQLGSNPSIYSGCNVGQGGSQHSTNSLDHITSPPINHSSKPVNLGEDLYSWMAKQQEYMKEQDKGNLKGNWVSGLFFKSSQLYASLINAEAIFINDFIANNCCIFLYRTFTPSKRLPRYINSQANFFILYCALFFFFFIFLGCVVYIHYPIFYFIIL